MLLVQCSLLSVIPSDDAKCITGGREGGRYDLLLLVLPNDQSKGNKAENTKVLSTLKVDFQKSSTIHNTFLEPDIC